MSIRSSRVANRATLRRLIALSVLSVSALLTTPAQSAPRVAADIPPVHSLVAQVMEGVGEPELVIQRGASPHDYALRPSEAAALEQAEIVFWTSAELTPWLDRSLQTLAADATQIQLIESRGTTRYAFREAFLDTQASGHDHGHEQELDTHKSTGDHDHAHDSIDPHAWLDPVNAQNWLGVIAETLAKADPENAATYRGNAQAGDEALNTLMDDIRGDLQPVSDEAFIVFHDAYQYFERRFEVTALGSIALSDASDPSAARIAEIREVVRANDVRCVFAEPQFNPDLVETVLDGTQAETGVLDPLGSDIPSGLDFYPALIEKLSSNLVECLGSG